jgi:DNA-binding HxlR family transcriptional regulator
MAMVLEQLNLICREVIKDFDENPEWQLTPKAEELCKKIFAHIENCNSK